MNILRSRVFLTSFAQKGKKNSKETFSITSEHPLRKSHHPCRNKVDKWPLNRLYRLDVLSLDCVPFIICCSVCRPLLCFTDTNMQEFFPLFSCLSFPLSPVLASNRLEADHISAYPSAHLTTHYSSVPADALEIIRCLWLMEYSIVLREYYGSSIVVLRWTPLEGIH